MSQRDSTYARKERDAYDTPAWVTEVIIPFLHQRVRRIWEPAAGAGKMVGVLKQHGYMVDATDIADEVDFLDCRTLGNVDAIVTNPPYDQGVAFCEQALQFMQGVHGVVALLLRVDFDSGRTRSHLFRYCPAWSKKIVLTKRILWFEPEPGAKGKGPSENHAWYLWDWENQGAPTIAYAP